MKKLLKQIFPVFLSLIFLFLWSCKPKEEVVNLNELLPEGAIKEITHGYPDFAVTFVGEKDANVKVKFGEKFLRVDGIEEEERREKMAVYVLQYLENPNKAAEDKAKREAYQALPPKEKMADLVRRIKEKNPDFDYEWVGLEEGNMDIIYGDNSLLIMGVENLENMQEWAHAILNLQKEIDALGEETE